MKKILAFLMMTILCVSCLALVACDKDCKHKEWSNWELNTERTKEVRHCLNCGATEERDFVCEHKEWSAWQINADGSKEVRSCLTCDHTEEKDIVYDYNTYVPVEVEKTITPEQITASAISDSLYVKKVDNLSDDFILGMDASAVISLENGGVTYKDGTGNTEDVFKILAQNGINYIRVRVWVDPFDDNGKGYGGGNCDINTALEIGKRATKYGMKLLVDFHYSDFWADPVKQMCPKDWEGMGIYQKAYALYKYTFDSLALLKKNGVDVGMVQLGNETTNLKMSGETDMKNTCLLMQKGSIAVRQVYPDALIAVHFTNPEKSNFLNLAFNLKQNNVDYDVFATSWYPYWHGSLENLATKLSKVATTYDKKVMVAEVSYAYTPADSDFFGNTISEAEPVQPYAMTMQGQANCIRDVVDTIANKTTNGIGVFYWEGTWIAAGGKNHDENKLLWEEHGSGWASSYAAEYDPDDAGLYAGGCAVDNQALFDANGKALESLKVFALLKDGNEIENTPDSIALALADCLITGPIELPTQVSAIMKDNSRKLIDVVWEEYDEQALLAQGVAKHTIYGVADGMRATCVLSVMEKNFLQNYSFEDGDAYWTVIGGDKMDELGIEDKVSDSLTGTKHYHFWSAAKNSVEFWLEQTAPENIIAGTYKYSISIMGGDAGTTEIYAYVKVDGEIVKTAPLTITTYGEWDTAIIEDITIDGNSTVVVGIYVKCGGAGNGAWGKIDDAMLNLVEVAQ